MSVPPLRVEQGEGGETEETGHLHFKACRGGNRTENAVQVTQKSVEEWPGHRK